MVEILVIVALKIVVCAQHQIHAKDVILDITYPPIYVNLVLLDVLIAHRRLYVHNVQLDIIIQEQIA